MSDDAKPTKPELDYQLDKEERRKLLMVVQILEQICDMKPEAMPEFFTKASHDLAIIMKEQGSCTCAGCEQRRNAAKSNWN